MFVDGEIVEDDDVARPERRHEHLLHIGVKRRRINRPVEDRGGGQSVEAQTGDHRVGLPVAAQCVAREPRGARAAAMASEQIHRDPAVVEEDVLRGIVRGLRVLPLPTRAGDVRAPLLVGVDRSF
jgi:hypothetical protein